ncbi:MAG: A/G-specific adenine glycosylase [Dorea sp.]|nr:A/G-specific adenine glycosylase [Dorea sp.]
MRYQNITKGIFLERPNRFIAYVEIDGKRETVHVKNTGRCGELLIPGTAVYVQESAQPDRKTKWDLVTVEKRCSVRNGDGSLTERLRMVNIDSQAPNQVVKEWLEAGNLIAEITKIQTECRYGDSRFDLYVEAGERRIFIEVKGVSLEEDGRVRFPDAPSERAVKHVEELIHAVREGYEAIIFFVIQMKDVDYFTPNMDTHPEFGEVLKKAVDRGVEVMAYDCRVERDLIVLEEEVPAAVKPEEVVRQSRLQILKKLPNPLVEWFRANKRELPWRENPDAYQVWVSEIMLQQTRVEAVRPYYTRFLQALPDVQALASVREDILLKLWEGLGYYNRVRNMQKAARQIMVDYHGVFPRKYEEIRGLTGIGNYTAGAISSFAFGMAKPAVDGNVLRVISRITGSDEDIMKQSVRKKMEELLEQVIPADAASDFNQGLIELGAIVCVPNGEPDCAHCPVNGWCIAHREGRERELPVKKKPAPRRIEKRTILIFRDGETRGIRKRPNTGLLAGLYEFPGMEGHLTPEEVIEYSKSIGLAPVRIQPLGEAKHIFSHVEWHMTGYQIQVDELEKSCNADMIFARPEEIQKRYPMPAAFEKYTRYAV